MNALTDKTCKGYVAMSYCLLFVIMLCCQFGAVSCRKPTDPFVGDDTWEKEEIDLCDSPKQRSTGESCYTHIINYQKLNTEVTSRDPIVLVLHEFISKQNIDEFLAETREMEMEMETVVDYNNEASYDNARQANGTWIANEETIAASKVFRRAKSMMPFINFNPGDYWQVIYHTKSTSKQRKSFHNTTVTYYNTPATGQILSYRNAGHFAPHYDYIVPKADEDYEFNLYGRRFATFLLLLQKAESGGGPFVKIWKILRSKRFPRTISQLPMGSQASQGTVFPLLETAVIPSAGDVIFWINVDVNEEDACESLHGGCPVWEGEKVAAVKWILLEDQELFQSASEDGKFDIEKLIHPATNYFHKRSMYGKCVAR